MKTGIFFPLERAGKNRLALIVVPLAMVYVLTALHPVLKQNACGHHDTRFSFFQDRAEMLNLLAHIP